jgi:hypothetical protein
MSDTNHFGSWKLQDEFIECYGAYASMLNDVLGLLDAVSNRTKSIHEARIEAIARFRAVMEENVPACHKRVAAYQATLAAEQAEATKVSTAAYERREKLRLAEEQFQRDATAAHDKAQRDAYERSQEEVRAHRERFAQDERDRQSAIDQKTKAEAEDLERRIAAVEGQQ